MATVRNHKRKTMKGKKVLPDMRVTSELIISCDREVFRANDKNREALIMIISAEMTSYNITVCQAKDDDDTLIVMRWT